MADIVTIGGATRDITFLTDKGRVVETPENLTEQRLLGFEYGAKIRSEDVRMNFGSGACNAAASFAKMGLGVAVCTRVGQDDDGNSILENMAARGVDVSLIQRDGKERSGFSFVVLNRSGNGERVIFVHKGASNNLEIHSEKIRGAKWIYLTALCGDWRENLKKIQAIVKENDIKLAWNPGETEIGAGKEVLGDLLGVTDILILNKDEAIELVKSGGDTDLGNNELNDIEALIKTLKGWGPETVVITDGKNGAYLYDDAEILKAPAFIGKQVDTTGAGDAFGSGFLAGYMLTDNLETALKFGILNGAGTVTDYGAQNGILTREEIDSNLSAVQIERIN